MKPLTIIAFTILSMSAIAAKKINLNQMSMDSKIGTQIEPEKKLELKNTKIKFSSSCTDSTGKELTAGSLAYENCLNNAVKAGKNHDGAPSAKRNVKLQFGD